MREFIYFSKTARTSGNFKDLMKAGRMDIVCHAIISAFFESHEIRDVKLHLIFYGPPCPPKHIIITNKASISKRDVSGLIKRALYKAKQGKRVEALEGVWIEKKNLFDVIKELKQEGKEIYLLDKKGEKLREANIENEKAIFLLGDHDGLPSKELKRLKKQCRLVNIGPKTYFASHVISIVNNELDLREGF